MPELRFFSPTCLQSSVESNCLVFFIFAKTKRPFQFLKMAKKRNKSKNEVFVPFLETKPYRTGCLMFFLVFFDNSLGYLTILCPLM